MKSMFVIKREGNMKVPVRLFVNDNIKPDKRAIDKLKEIASIKGVYKAVVALPDIHAKFSRYTPTGIVVASEDYIIPKFVLTVCGITFFRTGLNIKDMNNSNMDKLFAEIKKRVSVSLRKRPSISKRDFEEIVVKGAGWIHSKGYLEKKDIDNIENKGNMFDERFDYKELKRLIPDITESIGMHGIGVLGVGNHFVEMQVIENIKQKTIAREWGIKNGEIVFMIHTDPELFSKSIFDNYSLKGQEFSIPRIYRKLFNRVYFNSRLKDKKTFLEFINKQANRLYRFLNMKGISLSKQSLKPIPAKSSKAKDYINSVNIIANYSFVSRLMIMVMIKQSLKKVFGKKAKTSLLYDGHHDLSQQEVLDGKKLWVNRSGSSRAHPPHMMKDHAFFSKTGMPVLIPGCMGDYSYLCAAKKGCKESFYSASHGAGRVYDKPEARKHFKQEDVVKEVESKIRLYRYKKGNIVEEAPSSYKSITQVIKVTEANNIAEVVARLRPVAVLKGN